jgi:probable rRNA maturation factor
MINIQNEQNFLIDSVRLQAAAQAVIDRHEVDEESSLSIVVSTNEAVHALNLQHRGVDAPTDVLSFPAAPLPEELLAELEKEEESEPPYLGDLVIAYPYASQQAASLKHDLSDSLALLVVHGTLHLLGYDHDTPENRAEMWEEQAAILDALDIDTSIVPSLEGNDHA